jgi:hypothetical protein
MVRVVEVEVDRYVGNGEAVVMAAVLARAN